ncbi:MAG: HAMP domain-containing histidine kinase [Rhodobacteraceae bacterium]|nr:HAMP domain-containing histidine kinase [Paracoccaceae bacterium]
MADLSTLARARGLIRSSPVRLALGLVAVFATVNLLSFAVAFVQLRASLEAQIAANLDQQIAGFRVTDDPATLVALVRAEAVVIDPEHRILVFLAPGGASFGNAEATLQGTDITVAKRKDGRKLGEDGYELRSVVMAQGILVLGESREPVGNLERTFLSLLGLSLIPTLLLSLGAGVWMALVSARRVGRIEAALNRMTQGDLAVRVADAGSDDDLSRIGQGIDRMAGAQQAAMAALRQVSADIAHDLKTPVQRMTVLLSDLRDRLPETTPEADIAERALAEAERATSVFQALLTIAQIEGGNAKSRLAGVNLSEIVTTFAEIYAPSAEDSGHVLTLAPLPGPPVTVMGDKTLLGQLVANLIENALRHTPAGATIIITLDPRPEATVLSVADNGPGIPEAERENVLRRLYRLECSRTTPGNGLGLSLVQAVAELHGARLVLSDNRPGLRVELRFPVLPS